jgi:hypothetical protein
VSYGPVLNAAAVLLACYGNVPPERAALVIGMLLGVPVSADWSIRQQPGYPRNSGRPGSMGRCSRRWRPATCWLPMRPRSALAGKPWLPPLATLA